VSWGVRTAFVMSVSFLGDGDACHGWSSDTPGTPARLGSHWVTETSGRPKSRTFTSKPCSAARSATGPWMMVAPSLASVNSVRQATQTMRIKALEADFLQASRMMIVRWSMSRCHCVPCGYSPFD
jgi:hypothetical protein